MIPSARDLVTPFLTKEELARVEHLIKDTPKLTEVFEKLTDAYPFRAKSHYTYYFHTPYESYIVDTFPYGNRLTIDFGVGTNYDNVTYPETNAGDVYRIIATVIAIAKDYISKNPNIEILSWSSIEKKGKPKTGETQRDRIYKAAVKKQFGISDKDIVEKDGIYWAYINGYDNISEGIVGDSIVCDNCGWTWKIKDGGNDLFICHKCGYDNTPGEETNDFFKPLKGDTTNSKPTNINPSKNLPPFNFEPETNKLDIDNDTPATAKKISNFLEHNAEFIEKLVSLTSYMMDHISIEPLPDINFIEDDVENAKNFFGRTAYYNPEEKSITLYTYGRLPKDVLRSYSHEMIHHKQNLEGKLQNINTQNINEDDYLKELELEAYRDGNGRFFREWENLQQK
jgi:hypothetical protein